MVLYILAEAILLFKCIIGFNLLVVHQRENVLQSLESIIQQSQRVVTTFYCSNLLADCATILANLVHPIRGNVLFGLLHNTGGSSFSVEPPPCKLMEFFSCSRSNRVCLLVSNVSSNLCKCSMCKFRYGPTGASKVTSRILVQRLQSSNDGSCLLHLLAVATPIQNESLSIYPSMCSSTSTAIHRLDPC